MESASDDQLRCYSKLTSVIFSASGGAEQTFCSELRDRHVYFLYLCALLPATGPRG